MEWLRPWQAGWTELAANNVNHVRGPIPPKASVLHSCPSYSSKGNNPHLDGDCQSRHGWNVADTEAPEGESRSMPMVGPRDLHLKQTPQ